MRCDRCGKFRKVSDVAVSDFGDQFGNYDVVAECRWCMSPADRKWFKMPLPSTPTEEGNSDE